MRGEGQIEMGSETGAGRTYQQEMANEGRGETAGATTTGAGTTYFLERWRMRGRGQIAVSTTTGAGTTYFLEVENEGTRSNRDGECNRGRDDIPTGDGE